jgi:sugar/nucleoside kinase (ribokinase family)
MAQEHMKSKHAFDILVAGEINPDLILSGNAIPEFGQVEKLVDSATLTIGSSSAIFACGVARLGLKVAFVSVCGDDIFGRYMLDEMSRRGVDVSNVFIVPGGQTGLSVILNRPFTSGSISSAQGDRAILTHSGLIAALKSDNVTDRMLSQSRHLHVASYFLQTALQPGLPGLFDRAHALGLSSSLDTNWDPSGEWRGFAALLQKVDVFLPNENEAFALAGINNVESASRRLSESCKVVVIKLGADGAIARSAGETVRIPTLKVEVVDTVGAGDTFDAGFLYGFLNGWGLERSLHMAVACGSLSTRHAGGTSAQPTLDEAMKYVPLAG